MANTLKVDFDLLGESEDAHADLTYDGRPFTGIAYEKDAMGRFISLSGYQNGKPCGPLRTWYPSGQIEQEQYYRGGALHGPWREWYPNGQPRVDAYYEHGHLLRSKRWGEDGTLVQHERHEGCVHSARVGERRAQGEGPLLDIDPSTWELVEKPSGWGRDPADLPDSAALSARAP
jgi:hypothetical protein